LWQSGYNPSIAEKSANRVSLSVFGGFRFIENPASCDEIIVEPISAPRGW
jgi:hypothetical protein